MTAGGPVGRLIVMANQIADFFVVQPGGREAAEVAAHLRAFWTPAMRRTLFDFVQGGGEGLSAAAREGVLALRTQTEPAVVATAPGDDAG